MLLLDAGTAVSRSNGDGADGANGGGAPHTMELPLEAFLSAGHDMGPAQLLVAVRLPLPVDGDYFWCTKASVPAGRTGAHLLYRTAL